MTNKLKKFSTKYPGVRYYKHKTRKHAGKPDRYYSIRYTLHGKQHEEALGWASEKWTAKLASEKLAELKKAIRTGDGPTSLRQKRKQQKAEKFKAFKDKIKLHRENITFNRVWKNFYFPFQKSNVSERSFKREEGLFRLWISPVIGKMPMKKINEINLQKIKSNMDKEGKSPRSIQYAFAVVRQVFNFANKNGLIDFPSPTKGFKIPKKDNKRYRFLTPSESHELLSALKNRSQNLYEMALISLHCGLRAGEIFALKQSDIDLVNNRLILTDTKSKVNRFAIMTNEVKAIFKTKKMGNKNDLVFPDRNGKKRGAISRVFSDCCNKMGLNDGITDRGNRVVFHTLRHTFASWLVQNEVPIYEISKLLGHSTIEMTTRYSHLAPDTYEKSAKIIEEISEKQKSDNLIELKTANNE